MNDIDPIKLNMVFNIISTIYTNVNACIENKTNKCINIIIDTSGFGIAGSGQPTRRLLRQW